MTFANADVDAVARVSRLFSLTFPILGVSLLTYIGLGRAVFGLFGVIGRRMPRRLRTALRRCYGVVLALAAASLHASILSTCDLADACERSPLHHRQCFFSTSLTLLLSILALFADRVMAPLLVASARPGPSFRDRVCHAAVVCAGWLAMGDVEAEGVLLMLVLTGRQVATMVPKPVRVWSVRGLKALVVYYTLLVLTHRCEGTASVRAPVAGTAAVLLL